MDDLLNTPLVGFMRFADDGTVLVSNRRLSEILGLTAADVEGRRVESILSVGGRIFYQTHLFPMLRLHGRFDEIYISLRSASGTEIPVLLNAIRREHEGGAVTDCVLIPISQRSRYEDEILRSRNAAEEAARAKDEFLAIVSHDLRTPLNAILGWIRILRTAKLEQPAIDKALETIERNARAQSQLIEDILDFSRIASGKLRLNVEKIWPAEVIEAAVEVVRPAAEAKNITLVSVLDPKAGPVSGDADRLQQVMWNLLSNAIKFTPKDGRVQVRLARTNSHVEITVSDTGRGISAEFLPYVFERFRQAENSGERQSGLGLGMAITRQIVELHGGTVSAESSGEGEGATFTVELPLVSVHAEKTGDIGAAAQTDAGNGHEPMPRLDGLHILIVDDERDARDLLIAVLTESGATITAAETATEALEKMQKVTPDVLVSDIGMQGDDGYSLIRAVRNLDQQKLSSTPAIALTGQARFSDRMRALQAGYQMHVPKPVEPAELIMLIANLSNRN